MSAPTTAAVEIKPSAQIYFSDLARRVPVRRDHQRPRHLGMVAVGLMSLHFRTSRILLESNRIVHTGALVRNKSLPVASVTGLFAPITLPMAPPTFTLVLQSRPGATKTTTLRLVNSIWDGDDLQMIADRVRVVVEDQPISSATVEQRLPGSMPLWMRRPLLVVIPLTIALVGGLTFIIMRVG